MATPRVKFTRKHGRDLCAAVGIVLVAAAVLYAMPELEVDFAPEDILVFVVLGAFLFAFKRVGWPLMKQLVGRRRVHHHRR